MSTLAQEAVVATASTVASAAAHRYLYLRLVKDVTASARLRRACRATAVALTASLPPIRVGAPPDITVIELRRK